MFKNYLIILIIVILLVVLYINNNEHFAGALTQANAEAVANISSMVNSGNMTVSNFTATEKLNLNTKFSLSGDNDNYFRIKNKDGREVFAIGQGNDSYLNTLYVNTLNVGEGNIVKGPNNNKFVFHTPNDGRKELWITPAINDNATDWNWSKGLVLKRDGNHQLGGNLKINGQICIGNTCLNEDHFKMLTGEKDIIMNTQQNMQKNGTKWEKATASINRRNVPVWLGAWDGQLSSSSLYPDNYYTTLTIKPSPFEL